MVDQCREGRGIKGGFTCEGWNLLTWNMKSEFGESFTKDKLKNRFKTLKKTYASMKAMLDLSRFGWDDTRKMVTAEPEVWKQYLAAHPKAIQYKGKSLPDWASLAIIFEDSVADGRDGFASNDPEPVEAEADDDIGLTQADEMNNVFENGLEDNDVLVIIGAVETIANGFSEYANKHFKERPSVDKCISNLAELGLPSGLYYKALRLLENERKAEFFVALPPMDREGWDCIGAIDGTHIPAWIRLEDQVSYRNRKGFLSQNVMVVVSFDMKFQYVFAGWEGSTSDSKVLQDALSRPYNRLQVLTECFGSAVSSEFQSCSGVLSSFGSVLLLCLGLPSCSAGLGLALQSLVSAGREELCN
ncbi:putative nuclease HARBI1 [Cinnamomum micranthum f. kanehirae]|uniref:Putative nuclease HARBI1 n=1 Tax=Cinnamomum micranthum f. kanehirae TaxID=337451 RepID=A0A3S3P2W9_9MAGN|nr:putative nuclease HARBI1 [Cinnamomum micranthum f. kanehirae]